MMKQLSILMMLMSCLAFGKYDVSGAQRDLTLPPALIKSGNNLSADIPGIQGDTRRVEKKAMRKALRRQLQKDPQQMKKNADAMIIVGLGAFLLGALTISYPMLASLFFLGGLGLLIAGVINSVRAKKRMRDGAEKNDEQLDKQKKRKKTLLWILGIGALVFTVSMISLFSGF